MCRRAPIIPPVTIKKNCSRQRQQALESKSLIPNLTPLRLKQLREVRINDACSARTRMPPRALRFGTARRELNMGHRCACPIRNSKAPRGRAQRMGLPGLFTPAARLRVSG